MYSRDLRLRALVPRIHLLGERALYELLREINAGAEVLDCCERYARLADPGIIKFFILFVPVPEGSTPTSAREGAEEHSSVPDKPPTTAQTNSEGQIGWKSPEAGPVSILSGDP